MATDTAKQLALLLDTITAATELDSKTVPIRVLKCLEELGELSQAVLRNDGVDAWSSKTASKEDVQEEAADVLNVILSIMVLLGDDEVLDRALFKAHMYYAAVRDYKRVVPGD